MMKKIIISAATLQKGGAERVISLLSKEFLQYFDSVEIITWLSASIGYVIDSRVKVVDIQTACKSSNLLCKMRWFRRYVIEQKPTILLSFLAPFNLLVLLSLMFVSIPIFVSDRSNPKIELKFRLHKLLRLILYPIKAKSVIVQSYYNKSIYPVILRKNMEVIPNPCFLSGEKIGLGLSSEKNKKIVGVGRLIKEKNFELLIRSFYEISEQFTDYKLFIYGEGILRTNLESLITSLSLSDRVFLIGAVDNIEEHIKDAELFVFSSKIEGMPNALIEAMGVGLPVISTNIAGIDYYIKNSNNGLLIDSEDKCAMVEKIRFMLTNPSTAENMGRNATDIAKELNIQSVTKRWIILFNKKINESTAKSI